MQLSFKFCIAFLLLILPAKAGFGSDPPGIVVSAATDFKKDRLQSPSIVILPNGDYLVSHGWRNEKTKDTKTLLFKSTNQGRKWEQIGEHPFQFGATLFTHNGDLYLMGVRKHFGNMSISRSSDGGVTWTQPIDETSGLLTKDNKFYTHPNPVLISNGRIYRAYEDWKSGNWRPMVASAPADSDLLKASNWTFSNKVEHNKKQFGGNKELLLDGNVVKAPDGSIYNFLWTTRRGTHAAILPLNESGTKLDYDPDSHFVHFPLKFPNPTIRYDQESKRYWSIGEKPDAPYAKSNIVALVSSPDLRNWKVETILLRHINSVNYGFRSTDWRFDGKDIVFVCATAWGKTTSIDGMSYITFHRAKNFRNLTMADSPKLLGDSVSTFRNYDQLTVGGLNFEMKIFRKGEKLFSNRNYRIKNIPGGFKNGWEYTQTDAGNLTDLSLKIKKDTDVYFATAITQELIDVSGWKVVPDSKFTYGDSNRTEMRIFTRSAQAGQTIKIPEGNWSGGIVLIHGKK